MPLNCLVIDSGELSPPVSKEQELISAVSNHEPTSRQPLAHWLRVQSVLGSNLSPVTGHPN